MKKSIFLIALSIISVACKKSSVDKKEEGVLHYKESVTIHEIPKATLTFFDIADSRCPEGVQCIVAGSARVNLVLEGVTTEGRIAKSVKMCLGDCSSFLADTVKVEFAGNKYQLILKSVNPFPKKDVQPDKAAYNITIEARASQD